MNQTQIFILCYSFAWMFGGVAGGRGFGILSAKCINIITE